MPPTPPDWIATQATVTTCTYQSSALSAMAFGIPLGQKFLITFDYYAHARLYSGQFGSPKAIPQNSKIPLAYNPLAPEQNTYAQSTGAGPIRSPLIAFGVAGSIVLSLAWLLVLHSCH